MAESTQTPILLIAKILGISSSVFLSGFAFTASYLAVPSIGLSPLPLRLQQWQIIYDLGKWISPPVAAFSGAVWGFISYSSYTAFTSTITGRTRTLEDWKLYALGGMITFAVLPFTVLFIGPVNGELLRRAERARLVEKGGEKEEGKKMETERMLNSWSNMTYVRAVLPMVGAWVGLYAALR